MIGNCVKNVQILSFFLVYTNKIEQRWNYVVNLQSNDMIEDGNDDDEMPY